MDLRSDKEAGKRDLLKHAEIVMQYLLNFPKPFTPKQHILYHRLVNLLGKYLESLEFGKLKKAKELTFKIDELLVLFFLYRQRQ